METKQPLLCPERLFVVPKAGLELLSVILKIYYIPNNVPVVAGMIISNNIAMKPKTLRIDFKISINKNSVNV